MHKSRALRVTGISAIFFTVLFIVTIRRSELSLFAQSTFSSAPAAKDQDLIDAYRHVEVASVSDALEQLTGRRMYMSHKMQPIFPTKFAGFALTADFFAFTGLFFLTAAAFFAGFAAETRTGVRLAAFF